MFLRARARTWDYPTSPLTPPRSFTACSDFIQRTLIPYSTSEFTRLSSVKDGRSLFLAHQHTTYCIHSFQTESCSLLKGPIHKYSVMLKRYFGLLAGCLRGDLLLWGYCFHPSYYLWFGRNLHICFIPLYNIERYHVADKNNTKWLQCMLLHWYSSSCCQILRAKSNWIVITAVARPHKNDEEQCNGRASELNVLTLLNYFAESQSWHAGGNIS